MNKIFMKRNVGHISFPKGKHRHASRCCLSNTSYSIDILVVRFRAFDVDCIRNDRREREIYIYVRVLISAYQPVVSKCPYSVRMSQIRALGIHPAAIPNRAKILSITKSIAAAPMQHFVQAANGRFDTAIHLVRARARIYNI